MQDCKEHDIVTLTTTVGSLADAEALARAIVEARLGACVQLESIALSVYRWEGKACAEPEVRLTVKTVAGKLEQLESLFEEKHPYDLPQFTAWPVQASPAYADWVRSEVSPPGR